MQNIPTEDKAGAGREWHKHHPRQQIGLRGQIANAWQEGLWRVVSRRQGKYHQASPRTHNHSVHHDPGRHSPGDMDVLSFLTVQPWLVAGVLHRHNPTCVVAVCNERTIGKKKHIHNTHTHILFFQACTRTRLFIVQGVVTDHENVCHTSSKIPSRHECTQ